MNTITPNDVGRRVSVRRALPDAAPGRRFTDVVGELTSYTDGLLTITRRDGSVTTVNEAELVAAKVVPAPPARGPAAVPPARLQELAAEAWPAVETARAGDWLLRAAGGFTRRANSALAVGDPGMPLARALDTVRDWYAARDLPALLQVFPDGDADRAAAGAGWTAEGSSLVLTGRLATVLDRIAAGGANGPDGPDGPDAPDIPGVPDVAVDDAPAAGWFARYRSGACGPDERHVLSGPRGTWFARAGSGPVPDAIGRCAVRGRYAGFAAVEVAPGRRRSGLARAVVRALTARALAEGATTGWLQVEAGNAPAIALYEGLGFTVHHAYHYRRAPGAPA